MTNARIVDIDCGQRGITGEIHFDTDKFDELEMLEISEMLARVLESWCRKRDFKHQNLKAYDVVFN